MLGWVILGARDRIQELLAVAVLAEDLGLVPSCHVATHHCLYSSRRPDTLLDSMWFTYIHAGSPTIKKKKKNISFASIYICHMIVRYKEIKLELR